MISTKKLSRRNFLLAVGAGSAATAAAIATRTAEVAAPAPGGENKKHGKGYEESAHVRNYYRTTRI